MLGCMNALSLSCACGTITGELCDPSYAQRLRCYCDDCQTFIHYLGRDDVLDADGGSDILQSTPSRIRLRGVEHLGLVRLSEKGLMRWYATCCRTPIANGLGAKMPFIGVFRTFVTTEESALQEHVGRGHGVHARYAKREVPDADARASFGIIARTMGRLGASWIRRQHQPSPFFRDGEPVAPAQILSLEERNAHRKTAGV